MWNAQQEQYWNAVAPTYDTLYHDSWSILENSFVYSLLSPLVSEGNPDVMDLGCGTGLGHELCMRSNPATNYTGIDISVSMIEQARAKFPEAHFFQRPMSDLGLFASNSFDVVMSIFGAFSYELDPISTLRQVKRILRPGGSLLLCVVSRWSLRRLSKLRFRSFERYGTRNATPSQSAPVLTYGRTKILRMLDYCGFAPHSILGLGAFSGVIQISKLWKIDRLLCNKIPEAGHLLVIHAGHSGQQFN